MYTFSNLYSSIFRWALLALSLCLCNSAKADTLAPLSSNAVQHALMTNQHVDLYAPVTKTGFALDSAYFSGSTSSNAAPSTFSAFQADQQLYALLIDGRYNFDGVSASGGALALHPYISGGLGVATTAQSSLNPQTGAAVPLFRMGAGIAYRLDPGWDVSLDYKAGMATSTSGDQVFTTRGNQTLDLQSFNVAMSYAF